MIGKIKNVKKVVKSDLGIIREFGSATFSKNRCLQMKISVKKGTFLVIFACIWHFFGQKSLDSGYFVFLGQVPRNIQPFSYIQLTQSLTVLNHIPFGNTFWSYSSLLTIFGLIAVLFIFVCFCIPTQSLTVLVI